MSKFSGHQYASLILYCCDGGYNRFDPAHLDEDENLPENWKIWIRRGHVLTIEEKKTPSTFKLRIDDQDYCYYPFVLCEECEHLIFNMLIRVQHMHAFLLIKLWNISMSFLNISFSSREEFFDEGSSQSCN